MSQAGILNNQILPPTVGVETLTGNSGGPVPPTLNNINVIGDGTTVNVVGTPGTSTLTISVAGTAQYTLTTTDAVPHTIATFPVPNNNAIALFVEGIAARSDFSGSLAVTGTAAAKTALAITSLSGAPDIAVVTSMSTPAITFTVSGNNLLVNVVGETATTVRWTLNILAMYQT